jgi:hypothetical protein
MVKRAGAIPGSSVQGRASLISSPEMRQWDLIERNRLAKALAWSERDIAGIQKRGSISGKFGGLDVKIGIVEYVSGCRVRHLGQGVWSACSRGLNQKS